MRQMKASIYCAVMEYENSRVHCSSTPLSTEFDANYMVFPYGKFPYDANYNIIKNPKKIIIKSSLFLKIRHGSTIRRQFIIATDNKHLTKHSHEIVACIFVQGTRKERNNRWRI